MRARFGVVLAFLLCACGEGPSSGDGGLDGGADGIDSGGSDSGGSDASPSDDAGPTSIPVDVLQSELLEVTCAQVVECEVRLGAFVAGILEPTCHPELAGAFWREIDEGLAAGTITYDGAAAEACLEAFRTTSCETLLDEGLEGTPCDDVFIPTLAIGEDCAYDAECIDGYCERGATCPGTCTALGSVSALCADDDECADGLVCIGILCQARSPVSGSCGEDSDCIAGAYCTGGFCVDRPAATDACTLVALAPSPCAGRTVCSPDTGTCVAGAPLNEACDAQTPCALGLRCNTTSSTCIELRLPGESCSADIECPWTFWCSGGTCQPLPVVGESCALAPRCVEGDCMAGVCMPVGDGGTCPNALEASFGACAPDLRCSTGLGGTCIDRLPAGTPCSGDVCAETLECRDLVCRPRCTAN